MSVLSKAGIVKALRLIMRLRHDGDLNPRSLNRSPQ
jgi:hypothetical protein